MLVDYLLANYGVLERQGMKSGWYMQGWSVPCSSKLQWYGWMDH